MRKGLVEIFQKGNKKLTVFSKKDGLKNKKERKQSQFVIFVPILILNIWTLSDSIFNAAHFGLGAHTHHIERGKAPRDEHLPSLK